MFRSDTSADGQPITGSSAKPNEAVNNPPPSVPQPRATVVAHRYVKGRDHAHRVQAKAVPHPRFEFLAPPPKP
ncbi:hypothetical protein PSP31121_05345 [Pandoraea sputorum]|uniref:Uncharacterized protein n=1 Tax=Pandoraea sputorum TaxID=93222 RepID=A0A5E5BMY2_9BURK|nr:hypothetical protein PSP31121_05345 [Pandoraea sputorum]